MKKLLLTSAAILVAGSMGLYAQGLIESINGNTGGMGTSTSIPVYSTSVTSDGLVFTMDTSAQEQNAGGRSGSSLIGVNFNVIVYGGSSAALALPSAGQQVFSIFYTQSPDMNYNYGLFDGNGASATVVGVADGGTAYLDVLAWEGTSATYDTLAYHADSGVFANPYGGGIFQPKYMTGMPDVQLIIPEPATFALAGLGLASLLIFRRRQ